MTIIISAAVQQRRQAHQVKTGNKGSGDECKNKEMNSKLMCSSEVEDKQL